MTRVESAPILQASSPGDAPARADYDGDGFTDIALKGANGVWYIDVAKCSGGKCLGPDGFGGRWDFAYEGYGNGSAVPVPADYGRSGGDGLVDSLHQADLSIKDSTGFWGIDFADNGYGTWDVAVYGCGDAGSIPVPADYDGDGITDLAIKNSSGQWLIDYASNGFHGWDPPNKGCAGWPTFSRTCTQLPAIYGGPECVPVPADYNGDGRADLSVKCVSNGIGTWKIDYSNVTNTGFGSLPTTDQFSGYGDATAVPVPFNYDPWRDNKADLAIKNANGDWYINYAYDGFSGGWNLPAFSGYGGSWSTAVPGDYDHDGSVDLAVKDTSGNWYIDYGNLSNTAWAGWNQIIDNTGRPIVDYSLPYIYWTIPFAPIDYSPDLATGAGQCSVTTTTRCTTSAGCPSGQTCVGNQNGTTQSGSTFENELTPEAPLANGHYQLRIGVRYTVALRVAPGYQACSSTAQCHAPYGTCSIGAQCTTSADCGNAGLCSAGTCSVGSCTYTVGAHVNPDIHVPIDVLALEDPVGATSHVTLTGDHTRMFAVTCRQPGSYPLGFMLVDNQSGDFINPDYGIRVDCVTDYNGLYGTVTQRTRDANSRYVAGARQQASVRIQGPGVDQTIPTDSLGRWFYAAAPGGPYSVTVTATGRSPTVAKNITVPAASGVRVDTPLEESFSLAGMSYTTYLDYSRGRTILHTVAVTPQSASIKLARSATTSIPIPRQCSVNADCGQGGTCSGGTCTGVVVNKSLVQLATERAAPVVINGGYFDGGGTSQFSTDDTLGVLDDSAVGYFYGQDPASSYASKYINSLVDYYDSSNDLFASPGSPNLLMHSGTLPMFTITGSGTSQTFSLITPPADFTLGTGGWAPVLNTYIYDAAAPFGQSDFTYAMQASPPLELPTPSPGTVIARGQLTASEGADRYTGLYPDMAWARTAVGFSGSTVYLVVADGEGVNGGHGATFNQLGEFFRDVLQASAAMNFDGGLSSEMVINTPSGRRNINTITGEDGSQGLDFDRTTEGDIAELCCGPGGKAGGLGSVFDYLSAGL